MMLSALVERLDEQLHRVPSPNAYPQQVYPQNPNGNAGIENLSKSAVSEVATETRIESRTDIQPHIPSKIGTHGKTNGNGTYGLASSTQLPPIYGTQVAATNPATTVFQPQKTLTDDWWQGFFLVLAASVILSLQNIFVKVALSPSDIFGGFHQTQYCQFVFLAVFENAVCHTFNVVGGNPSI
jgi:hypothetical protein